MGNATSSSTPELAATIQDRIVSRLRRGAQSAGFPPKSSKGPRGLKHNGLSQLQQQKQTSLRCFDRFFPHDSRSQVGDGTNTADQSTSRHPTSPESESGLPVASLPNTSSTSFNSKRIQRSIKHHPGFASHRPIDADSNRVVTSCHYPSRIPGTDTDTDTGLTAAQSAGGGAVEPHRQCLTVQLDLGCI